MIPFIVLVVLADLLLAATGAAFIARSASPASSWPPVSAWWYRVLVSTMAPLPSRPGVVAAHAA
jgi:hypothetical protein